MVGQEGDSGASGVQSRLPLTWAWRRLSTTFCPSSFLLRES